jgi:hypothetical protein
MIGNQSTLISMQWLGHAFTFHRRMCCWWYLDLLCKHKGRLRQCRLGQHPASWVVSDPFYFFAWTLKQSWMVQLLILLPFVAYACLVAALEYMLAAPAPAGWLLLLLLADWFCVAISVLHGRKDATK